MLPRILGLAGAVCVLAACGSGRTDLTSTQGPAAPDPQRVARAAICRNAQQAMLYTLPYAGDPGELPYDIYDSGYGRIGRVSCDRLVVVGRVPFDDPASIRWFKVRVEGDRVSAWVFGDVGQTAAQDAAFRQIPIATTRPLHPKGLPDLTFGRRRSQGSGGNLEGAPCVPGTGFVEGGGEEPPDLVNRGRATSPAAVRVRYSGESTTTETFRLIRGLEPGEAIDVLDTGLEIRIDPGNKIRESNEKNNTIQLDDSGSGYVYVCG